VIKNTGLATTFVHWPRLLASLAGHIISSIRFRVAKFIYDRICFVVARAWQEPLRASLVPRANDRILDFGAGSGLAAVTFARRFPQATFIGADPNPKAVEKARRSIARRQLPNVKVITTPLHGRIPFDAGSFDQVVSVLTFHDRTPQQKLEICDEMFRILRRGGTLHVADFDKPATRSECRILTYAERVSGQAAAEPHMNGSWTTVLKKARFAGVRYRSYFSVGVGRIGIVKARKR
jgi:ubiquinone/menaquinone biosynthesis C-methylase UbiE